MKKSSPVCIILFLFLMVAVSHDAAIAQGRQRVVSPEINPDRTVTFRFNAPQAHQVLVSCQFVPEQAMKKNENGIWSVTLGPLEPEIYEYSFTVDGVSTIDPLNSWVKLGLTTTVSLMEVKGDKPTIYEARQVPHGVVNVHTFHSPALDESRSFQVYTPPGYDSSSTTKYPVLYLLHGGGDDDRGWIVVGRANLILDNLIADGKATPMIIIIPNGSYPRGQGIEDAYKRDLLGYILPYVEENYQVYTDSKHRAMTGLSMGGGQTLDIGVSNLDMFNWLGVMSNGISAGYEKTHGAFLDEANDKLDLFWCAIGEEDFLLERFQDMRALFNKRNVKHVAHISDGGHTWNNWRIYLNEFAQLLFK